MALATARIRLAQPAIIRGILGERIHLVQFGAVTGQPAVLTLSAPCVVNKTM